MSLDFTTVLIIIIILSSFSVSVIVLIKFIKIIKNMKVEPKEDNKKINTDINKLDDK